MRRRGAIGGAGAESCGEARSRGCVGRAVRRFWWTHAAAWCGQEGGQAPAHFLGAVGSLPRTLGTESTTSRESSRTVTPLGGGLSRCSDKPQPVELLNIVRKRGVPSFCALGAVTVHGFVNQEPPQNHGCDWLRSAAHGANIGAYGEAHPARGFHGGSLAVQHDGRAANKYTSTRLRGCGDTIEKRQLPAPPAATPTPCLALSRPGRRRRHAVPHTAGACTFTITCFPRSANRTRLT